MEIYFSNRRPIKQNALDSPKEKSKSEVRHECRQLSDGSRWLFLIHWDLLDPRRFYLSRSPRPPPPKIALERLALHVDFQLQNNIHLGHFLCTRFHNMPPRKHKHCSTPRSGMDKMRPLRQSTRKPNAPSRMRSSALPPSYFFCKKIGICHFY